ncbi:phosphatase PAP2 family protein [Acidithiobacillus concretivorus]|uniref:Phosphatase PAP2 family protein n=1 Tax=Acidithiobacillus concretivorus TaxID=3063952 RepID=A0ABS5ZPQ3_9PROT|nr:phosphatase PAP2 family protein [Acidithiobacillus concretivorus]MBU2738586.1 phosphatase PAP2 family protein [Acidithiobacillus concretivorus]
MKALKSMRLPQPAFQFQPRVWAGDFQRGIKTLLTWPEVQIGLVLAFITLVLLQVTKYTLTGMPMMVNLLVLIAYCFLGYASYAGQVPTPENRRRRAIGMQTHLGLGAFVLINASLAVMDYILTGSIVLPEWDKTFASWDLALGFHWLYWYHVVQATPDLHLLLKTVYGLLAIEIAALIVVLPLSGHVRAGRWLVLWYAAVATICITIGLLMPARGAFVFYHLPVMKHTAYVPVMADLRNGSLQNINLSKLQGLVVFPSFHAALAVICAAGAWSWKYLRYPLLILNLLIILSAPSQGGHYGVDVLAGIAIALVTIYFVRPQRSTAVADV